MKKLFIVFTVLILVSLSNIVKCQEKSLSGLEFVYGNEDKALGFNYFHTFKGVGFIIGSEFGIYRYEKLSKVRHEKYRLGLSVNYNECDNLGDFILYAAYCYNEYDVIRNIGEHINVDKLKPNTVEVGIKLKFKGGITSGFNYDLIHTTGSFTLGFTINR